MQIEEQIKTLLRIKAKIDLYKTLIQNINLESKSTSPAHKTLEVEHPALLNEFCNEVLDFCNQRVSLLGNPSKLVPSKESKPVIAETEAPVKLKSETKLQQAVTQEEEEPRDPLRFLMKYKHMEGKRITFTTKDGIISGIVKGMVAPNLVVETDSGYRVTIKPKEVKEESSQK